MALNRKQPSVRYLSFQNQWFTLWIRGFLAAFLIIWIVSPSFLDTVPVWEYDSEMDRYVMANGHVQRGRSEGWGSTIYGKHEIAGIPDVENVLGDKVAIYGDSFVESHQLPDCDKLPQQVTQFWNKCGRKPITAVGIAQSGRSVSDHYGLIPSIEKRLHPIAHYIVLADITDLNPDSAFDQNSLGYSLEPKEQRFIGIKFRKYVSVLHLEFLYNTTRRFLQLMRSPNALRFSLGEAGGVVDRTTQEKSIGVPPVKAWRYIILKLKESTHSPIGFIYTPGIPKIESGKIVKEDVYADWVAQLRMLCDEEEIAFIDVTAENIALYESKKVFPRGFNNGMPDKGHCNAQGIRVIAEAIVDHLENMKSAFYPD